MALHTWVIAPERKLVIITSPCITLRSVTHGTAVVRRRLGLSCKYWNLYRTKAVNQVPSGKHLVIFPPNVLLLFMQGSSHNLSTRESYREVSQYEDTVLAIWDSHYKDTTVSRPYHLYYGNPSDWNGGLNIPTGPRYQCGWDPNADYGICNTWMNMLFTYKSCFYIDSMALICIHNGYCNYHCCNLSYDWPFSDTNKDKKEWRLRLLKIMVLIT